jgi:glutaminyl-tRNA synthetase
VTAYVEPAVALARREDCYQFERHGYFIADAKDHDGAHPVFNRAVTLRDPWAKGPGKR